jgi:hypothetical protein
VEEDNGMADTASRLSAILEAGESGRSATEAVQMADIIWMWGELDDLRLPADQHAAWRWRVDALDHRVHELLDRLAKALANGGAATSDAQCDELAARIDTIERQQGELFEEIETLELDLVLAFPQILSGRYQPFPPHLRNLSDILADAKDLWRNASSDPAPSGPIDFAVVLVDASRQCSASGSLEQASRTARAAVDILRSLVRAHPDVMNAKLGAALITLAASHLDAGQVEDATAAAAEACRLVRPADVPPELRGLVGMD